MVEFASSEPLKVVVKLESKSLAVSSLKQLEAAIIEAGASLSDESLYVLGRIAVVLAASSLGYAADAERVRKLLDAYYFAADGIPGPDKFFDGVEDEILTSRQESWDPRRAVQRLRDHSADM